jgi:hypothetical protein
MKKPSQNQLTLSSDYSSPIQGDNPQKNEQCEINPELIIPWHTGCFFFGISHDFPIGFLESPMYEG